MSGESLTKDKNGVTLWAFNQVLVFFCLVGLGLSLYAYTVELTMEEHNGNKGYKPYCDIYPYMSCTKAFGSKYGKGFGIFGPTSVFYKPNSFFGIVFYSMVATLCLFNSPIAVNASLVLIMLSNFASLYFAYILYFILNDLCPVCLGTYLVNAINLILITRKHKKVKRLRKMIENLQGQQEVLNNKNKGKAD